MLQNWKQSTAWNQEWNLPFTGHNNPFIYCAYAIKLLKKHKISAWDELALKNRLDDYADLCEKTKGLYDRWPDGHGGVTSHDELIGIVAIIPERAEDILLHIMKNDGVYCNVPQEYSEKFNLYRFPWFIAYLKAAAGYRLGIVSHTALIWLLISNWRAQELQDAGGRLRIWLMLDHLRNYPLLRFTAFLWAKKQKFSLEDSFAIEPKEYPIYKDSARNLDWS